MTKIIGQQGEAAVVVFLQQQGFKILETNYRKFFGEIDIIARQGNVLSFVEVKARKNSLVSMHELVPPVKQRKIILVAKTFISKRELSEDIVYRFDVALVLMNDHDCNITYIPNAFGVAEY